jgi:hypothetical protein
MKRRAVSYYAHIMSNKLPVTDNVMYISSAGCSVFKQVRMLGAVDFPFFLWKLGYL